MIGIVIISHGNLASEMINALEHLVGKQTQIDSITILTEDNIEHKRKELITKVDAVNSGKGVVIFTDIFGGTASNLAITLLKTNEIEVVAGVNIPMLVKMAQERSKLAMEDLLQTIIETGKKYITSASGF